LDEIAMECGIYGKKRNVYTVFVGKFEGKRAFRRHRQRYAESY
jgi:hypothetical protein